MNERQLTALMERVGETLEPDVPALVAGGAARGRVRRRRRAVAGALTGVAAVGAVALAAALLPRGGADAGPDVADTAPPSRVVAVAPSDMDETLAALLPGARPVLHDDAPYQHQLRRGAVRWHGATVTVTIDSRSVGTTTSARERCETFADGVGCTAGAGGAWVYVHGSVELNVRTGREESYQDLVRVYDADGYLIEAGGEKGPGITRDLLRSLALDPVWFR